MMEITAHRMDHNRNVMHHDCSMKEGLNKSIEGLVSASRDLHMSGLAHAFIKCFRI